MTDPGSKIEPTHFLSGWKEIANYIGKGVRTVQRYERYLGLPVRRPAGHSCGALIATKAEIDAWVGASPIRRGFELTRSSNDPQNEAFTSAVKNRIADMEKLRDRMAALRTELKTSVHMLRESIQSFHGEMNGPWLRSPRVPNPEFHMRAKAVSDLAAMPTKGRKVS